MQTPIFHLLIIVTFLTPLAANAGFLESYLKDEADQVVRLEVQSTAVEASGDTSSWLSKLRRFLGIRRQELRPAPGTMYTVNSSGYAPSPYQTDATPCLTAAGTSVRSGVVASNFLPLGTIVEINGLEYIVEDRMNSRYQGYFLDIWFPSTSRALEFGRQELTITIKGYGQPGQSIRDLEPIEPASRWQLVQESLASIQFFSQFLGTRANPDQFDINCFEE